MKTQLIASVFVLTDALWAGNGCSKSSRTSPDGAAGALKGTGGMIGDAGQGGHIGTGGSAGTSGLDAGAGGGIPDGPSDLPLGSGGTADANRDVTTSPANGGKTGTGGRTGAGGATDKGGSSGIDGGAAQNLCGYECRTDASGVAGWYSGTTLLCTADCLGHKAICSGVGTRSEGCYADATSAGCPSSYNGLIAHTTCGTDCQP